VLLALSKGHSRSTCLPQLPIVEHHLLRLLLPVRGGRRVRLGRRPLQISHPLPLGHAVQVDSSRRTVLLPFLLMLLALFML
jgi:hypothetical protein